MVAASQTVYVDDVPQITASAMANYLQKAYGLELKVKLRKHASSAKPKGSKYALITFTSQEDAESAISESNYRWPNGNRIIVKQYTGERAAQHIEQPPKCSEVGERSILEKLAPDYLINIYKHLSPLDVANASETSDYLHDFAQSFIYKKCAHLAFDCKREPHNEKPFTWLEFERIIRHFGMHLQTLEINGDSFENASANRLTVLLEHCPNLSELLVVNFNFTNKLAKELRKQRSVIKNLRIFNFDTEHTFCKPSLMPFISGSVECLKLMNGLIKSDELFNQLQKHCHSLTHLALIDNIELSDRPYRDIGKMLPQLQSLQISVFSPKDLVDITGLNVLKNLQLVAIPLNNLKIEKWPLSGLPHLEELYISYVGGIKMSSFSELTSLRVLVLHHTYNISGIGETVNKLPNLQRLYIAYPMMSLHNMLHLIEMNTNRNLAVIECCTDPNTVHQLIDALVERDDIHFQLRLVVDQISDEWVETSRHLKYVHFVTLKDLLKQPCRFEDFYEFLIKKYYVQ